MRLLTQSWWEFSSFEFFDFDKNTTVSKEGDAWKKKDYHQIVCFDALIS